MLTITGFCAHCHRRLCSLSPNDGSLVGAVSRSRRAAGGNSMLQPPFHPRHVLRRGQRSDTASCVLCVADDSARDREWPLEHLALKAIRQW